MRCPSADTNNSSTNVALDEHIHDFANTKIDSKEKAELFASTLKYIIAELDKRSKFDNITALKTNATSNETASLMQNHPMFESISSKEEAVLQAAAMRLVASELARGPYGNVFNDINEQPVSRPVATTPSIPFYYRGKKVKNANYPTYRRPFDDVHGPNFSSLDVFS